MVQFDVLFVKLRHPIHVLCTTVPYFVAEVCFSFSLVVSGDVVSVCLIGVIFRWTFGADVLWTLMSVPG